MAENNIQSPHDRFFRGMMTDPKVIREFFAQNLPANIRKIINFDSISLQKDSFIDDNLRLQIADLLYSAEFDGKRGYLYLLVEHQTTPCQLMPFRLLKYMIAIMEQHLKKTKKNQLPVVYPIVIYHGPKNYNYSIDILDLFGEQKELAQDILWKPYQLIDLSKISDEKLKSSLRYGIMGYTMKHIYEKNFLPALKNIVNNLQVIEKQGEMSYIYRILSYVVEASEIKEEELINTVKIGLSNLNEEKVMTLAEQLRQEGWQKGKQEGLTLAEQFKQEGLQAGLQKGKTEAFNQVAIKLLNQGINDSTIAAVTGLSLQEIINLKKAAPIN